MMAPWVLPPAAICREGKCKAEVRMRGVARLCCVERGLAKGRTCTDTDHPMFSKLSRNSVSFVFLFFRLFLEGTSNFLVHHFCERLILDSLSRLQRLQDCHLTGVRLCLVCLAARTNFACESGMMPTTRHAASDDCVRLMLGTPLEHLSQSRPKQCFRAFLF